nr:DUF1972 domain-containing protein [uncultured Carboxylicivirga sp.]
MHIAIIGTRGIPNYYGGFEQFAQYLSRGLVKKGHQVTVYNSHKHPYQESVWKEVQLIHKFDPEDKIGTAGQFIYDLNCILDARKRNYDIILQLGYTSSSIWGWLLPRKNSIVTTNMDGLEWKRSKYSKYVQKFLLLAEKLGVKYSDYLISDSIGIQQYINKKYNKESIYIPYGSNLFTSPNIDLIAGYDVEKYKYNMLIARLEPENSVEIILEGVSISTKKDPFLVIGNHETEYGNFLKGKFKEYPNIKFIGGIYDIEVLNNLRHFSNVYFHGHTVGGTNPSLLEAMGSQALICANDNVFNKAILNDDAFYFRNSEDVKSVLESLNKKDSLDKLENNDQKIKTKYHWDTINKQYIKHFEEILEYSMKL